MPQMTEGRLKLLVYKYLAKNLTDAESQEFHDCAARHPEIWKLVSRLEDHDQVVRDLRKLYLKRRQATIPFFKRSGVLAAACILGVLVIAGGLFIAAGRSPSAKQAESPAIARRNDRPAIGVGDTAVRAGTGSDHMNTGINKEKQGIAYVILTLGNGVRIRPDVLPEGRMKSGDGSAPSRTEHGISYIEQASYTTLYHTLSTTNEGQFMVTLPDSTKVWLNGKSSLRYPVVFMGSTREVNLTGEAYFEVARNPSVPFIVHAKGCEVDVLGTNFNISAYQDEETVRTTLLEGSVQVSMRETRQLVRINEQLIAGGDTFTTKQVDPDRVIAWKEGYFSFSQTPISEVVRQLAERYDIQFVISDPAKERRFTAQLERKLGLDELLRLLNVTSIKEGKKVTILD